MITHGNHLFSYNHPKSQVVQFSSKSQDMNLPILPIWTLCGSQLWRNKKVTWMECFWRSGVVWGGMDLRDIMESHKGVCTLIINKKIATLRWNWIPNWRFRRISVFVHFRLSTSRLLRHDFLCIFLRIPWWREHVGGIPSNLVFLGWISWPKQPKDEYFCDGFWWMIGYLDVPWRKWMDGSMVLITGLFHPNESPIYK